MAKKKKSDTPTTSRRKTVYELVGERRPNIRRNMDPIDDILLEEERELAREHKRLRLEQIVEKRRREVEKMREGVIDTGSLPSNTDFLNMAKFMADLSPEESARVRNAYSFLKLAEKGGGGGMNMLPMLLNYARQNPGASEDQMVKYLQLMDSQMVKGMEMMKAANPQKPQGDPMTYMVKGMELMKTASPSKQDNPMEFLKLMKDLVIEGVRNPLLQAIEKSQPTPGVFDQIFTNPDLWNRFKEIGIFGGESRAGSTSVDLEIEKLRRESALEMKKLDLSWRKTTLETESKERSEDRKTDALLSALAPLSAILSGPVDQRMRQFAQQQAATHNPGRISPVVTPPQNALLINCSCGYQGPITFPGPPPDRVNCPSCGLELLVGGIPDASGNPEEANTGT